MTPLLPVLALSGLLALGGLPYGGTARADTLQGPGARVPYVHQGPLLCGGASAAMVRRFWGELGVYASDYAALVDRRAGGIHTDDLAHALAGQGYEVQRFRDDPLAALGQVRGDLPVIALLETGASRYHYVVVTAAGPDAVRIHDPLRRPGLTLSREEFLRRWSPSGYWALLAVPRPDRGGAGGAGPDRLAGPRVPPGPLPPPLRTALVDLRAGAPRPAADRIEAYLDARPGTDPHRGLALEMLATARYMAGEEMAALRAWNAIDLPPVDLVRVQGLGSLRYALVVDPLGLRPRELLTPEDLELARRRLRQLPAVALGRVGYRPLRDGSVEVGVAILERSRWPLRPLQVAAVGVGALVNRRAEVELGPVLTVGERWRLAGSWEPARRMVEGAAVVPWPPAAAVVTLRGGWLEERFATGGESPARSRSWGMAEARRWTGPRTRLGLSIGLERWDGGDRLVRAGASALRTWWEDRLRLGGSVDAWAGGSAGPVGGVARLRAAAQLWAPASPRRAWSITLGGTVVSRGGHPTLWDGAGTGRVRAPLLRGHPLVRDRRTGADAFGRTLLHASLGHVVFIPVGPGRAALEIFVDGARVGDPLVGEGPRSYVDPGVELSLSAGDRAIAVSLARGGDDWVVSARVGGASLPWLSTP